MRRHILRKPVDEFRYWKWLLVGKPLPPPHSVKQRAIREYGKRYGLSTLIETGTYKGDMVMAQIHNFETIYSIEVSPELCEKAKARFKPYPHVTILQGDSGKVLHEIVPKLDKPALFWLDGHYFGGISARGETDCPILQELDAVFSSPYAHILLIDDAMCFTGEGRWAEYPTMERLQEYILTRRPGSKIEVRDNLTRVEVAPA